MEIWRKILKLTIVSLFLINQAAAESVTINIKPGTEYKKRAPQIAIWIEDENETYVTTIFVTRKASENNYYGALESWRPESLPNWFKSRDPYKYSLPKEELDAATKATPKAEINLTKIMQLDSNKCYFIKAQVNQSFDYNESYTKQNSGVDGQPAILYSGKFRNIGRNQQLELEIQDKAENVTTADKIINKITVTIN